LREEARRAADRKDYGHAFELMSQAWESARSFPKDATLHHLSDELAAELEWLGSRANLKFLSRAVDPDTTLIEK